jgi:hypothetical protein
VKVRVEVNSGPPVVVEGDSLVLDYNGLGDVVVRGNTSSGPILAMVSRTAWKSVAFEKVELP